ncbi:MAG TPA: maleylpyruvate isomerase N-terminal domain-containing protein, partial [Acidimicrobiales bacterium]|nr:maleylpyruvate isomerase N-terminal domain-containing protein [Acidimicrobiales bacterium]
MGVDLAELRADLRTEQAGLRELLERMDEAAWDAPTPAAGWTVRHQVRHLAQGEELGRLAASDAAAF